MRDAQVPIEEQRNQFVAAENRRLYRQWGLLSATEQHARCVKELAAKRENDRQHAFEDIGGLL